GNKARIPCKQRIPAGRSHNRVLEKTACVAQDSRIGQLAPAYLAYSFVNGARRYARKWRADIRTGTFRSFPHALGTKPGSAQAGQGVVSGASSFICRRRQKRAYGGVLPEIRVCNNRLPW